MKYALVLAVLATPAAAHPGPHVNPHGDFWGVALALAIICAPALTACRHLK